jgi:hypothetical protein
MNFFRRFLLRHLPAPALAGVACFVLGMHQVPPRPGTLGSEDDLAMLNGCVVSACNYLAVVKAKHTLEPDFWAKVLLVRYENNSAGHAYCVWETEGTVYGYDRNSGGFPIPKYTKDPHEIASVLAVELSKHLGQELKVKSAEFVEPTEAKLQKF